MLTKLLKPNRGEVAERLNAAETYLPCSHSLIFTCFQ